MLHNVTQRYLAKLARMESDKILIEGYRPMWPASKDAFAYISVSGNTFPIKDELARAGLRWNPNTKSWRLGVSSQGDGFRMYDQIAPKVDKAFDVLEPLVRKFNADVDARNKALGKATVPEAMRHLDGVWNRNKFLQKSGMDFHVGAKNPIGGSEVTVSLSGNTFPFAGMFKKFGWKWAPTQKVWWVPFEDWKGLESKFLAALAQVVPVQPTAYPWAKGKVWLRNTELEDEAEDTGVLFVPAGPQQVSVQTTYLFPEYMRPPERMQNDDALKLWDRLTARGAYVPG